MYQSHVDVKLFQFKVILNQNDVMDLCVKDRTIRSGVETNLEVKDAMGEERLRRLIEQLMT